MSKNTSNKIYCLMLLIILICILFTSCRLSAKMPETVEINGIMYKAAISASLYPLTEVADKEPDMKHRGIAYYMYTDGKYDCYIAYDYNGEPNIYFSDSQYDEAVLYYTSSENFTYYCKFGNIHDEHNNNYHVIHNVNSELFEKLLSYASEKSYNPFTVFKEVNDLEEIPVNNSDDWMKDEIHFYKESNDGAFTTSLGKTFYLLDDKLVLLYYYDFGDEDNPVMLIRRIPSEFNDPDIIINQSFGELYE